MKQLKFQKNKTYYLQGHDWKLKYLDHNLEGYYNFRVTEHNDTEQDWWEYSTRDGSEILSDRKAWLLSIKDVQEKCALNQVVVSTAESVAGLGEEA